MKLRLYPIIIGLITSLVLLAPAQAALTSGHHVNHLKPSAAITMPKDWPLPQAKLECVSCHGDQYITNKSLEQVDLKASDFLRGGPYPVLNNFCQHCHQNDDYQANNIHQMIDRNDKIKKSNCLYCHDQVPQQDERQRRLLAPEQRAKLRLDKAMICLGCHLKNPHLNAVEHQVKVTKKIDQQRQLTELKLNISLPLGEGKQVICITCHAPHQRGVLDVDSPKGKQTLNDDLSRGVQYQVHSWNKIIQRDKRDRLKALAPALEKTFNYQQIKHEVLLRLPAKNAELCLACHVFSR